MPRQLEQANRLWPGPEPCSMATTRRTVLLNALCQEHQPYDPLVLLSSLLDCMRCASTVTVIPLTR